MADVFISYKAEDRRRIRLLAHALEQEGFLVWWDQHIAAGQEWRDQIASELETAKCVVVAWSKLSAGAEGRFVRDEASRALQRGVCVPLTLDDVSPPLGFGEMQAADLVRWRGSRTAPGYLQLVAAIHATINGEAPVIGTTVEPQGTSRRAFVGGVGAAGLIATGAGWLWFRGDGLSSEARTLLRDARQDIDDGGVEANANAIGKLRRGVELEPRSAAIWGLLAFAYIQQSQQASSRERQQLVTRGKTATARALSIENDQPDALAAHIFAMPLFRNWLAVERACRDALSTHPGHRYLQLRLAQTLGQVGRDEECLKWLGTVMSSMDTPMLNVGKTAVLWNLGRLDEAEAQLERMLNLWPRHFAVWFTRAYYLMYNKRAAESLAFLKDRDGRPTGIPDWNFALVQAQAESLVDLDRRKISETLQALSKTAHDAAGFAENLALYASFVGATDTAFDVLSGLYLNRGFSVAETWFSPEQAIYIGPERNTYILFQQPMRAVRRDSRFGVLVQELGLAEYWRRTNSSSGVVA